MKKQWIPAIAVVMVLVVGGCTAAIPHTPTDTEAVLDAHEPPATAARATPTADTTSQETPDSLVDIDADEEASGGEEEPSAAIVTSTPEPVAVLPAGVITGVLLAPDGPVPGASVRVQLTEYTTFSDEDGVFTLVDLPMTEPVIVAAWADGYYVGHTEIRPGLVPVTITMKPYYVTDNLDYEWFEFDGVAGSASCAPCHAQYEEWLNDSHSRSAVNPRFISMYEGTDVYGNRSADTQFGADGKIVPPDPDTYYGPGVKADYPDRNWNCAACHVPMASNLDPDNTCGWSGCHREITAEQSEELPRAVDATGLEDVNALDGIGCDFCHKIGEVYLDAHTDLPHANRPGISSMKLFRPEEGEQLFFGTSDDDIRRVSKLPLLEESAYCAPCHYGVFSGVVTADSVEGGVVIYNSYGEWLASPYSDPETGQTCQDCHMPPMDHSYFVYPEKGGLVREGFEVHNHDMPDTDDLEFMRESLSMTATATPASGHVTVEVDIVNDNTGHHVPTGAPQRHLILVVQASDKDGNLLPLTAGPVLPEWTGNYAGQPGMAYAKVLRDEWSGEVPSAAYWRDVTLVYDNRIAAFETATTSYEFELSADGPITVEAALWYRRSFQELAELKGWDDPDILMEEASVTLAH